MTASFPLGPNQGCSGGCILQAIDSPGSDGLLKMSLNHSLDLEASPRSLETWEDSRTPEWVPILLSTQDQDSRSFWDSTNTANLGWVGLEGWAELRHGDL